MRQEPRLQFTKEERADPALEKPIRKADRAADKAEKTRAKIPKKKSAPEKNSRVRLFAQFVLNGIRLIGCRQLFSRS